MLGGLRSLPQCKRWLAPLLGHPRRRDFVALFGTWSVACECAQNPKHPPIPPPLSRGRVREGRGRGYGGGGGGEGAGRAGGNTNVHVYCKRQRQHVKLFEALFCSLFYLDFVVVLISFPKWLSTVARNLFSHWLSSLDLQISFLTCVASLPA